MATARKKLKGYEIRQFVGIGSDGRRIDKQRTWYLPEGMTPKQVEKELERQKLLFEQEVLGNSTYCDGNLRFRDIRMRHCIINFLYAAGSFKYFISPATIACASVS